MEEYLRHSPSQQLLAIIPSSHKLQPQLLLRPGYLLIHGVLRVKVQVMQEREREREREREKEREGERESQGPSHLLHMKNQEGLVDFGM